MPELPDLQVFSINLKKRICNKKISSFDLYIPKNCNVDANELSNIIIGNEIDNIYRSGKELYFQLKDTTQFSVHLMLHGRFEVCSTDETQKIKHKILSFDFDGGESLAITDFQKICKITFNPPQNTVPDALGSDFTYAYFEEIALSNSKKNIKAFLIDQNIVRGIGNAYADEILWKANISPESVVGKIPKENLHSIYKAIGIILKNAIESIQTISPNIIAGEERSFLNVHRKTVTEDGEQVICKKIASKSTYYIEKQQLFA